MARHLSKEAKDEILNKPALYADVCNLINVKPASLPVLISRNSHWLTNHDVVNRICDEMDKTPDEILEEADEPAAT